MRNWLDRQTGVFHAIRRVKLPVEVFCPPHLWNVSTASWGVLGTASWGILGDVCELLEARADDELAE